MTKQRILLVEDDAKLGPAIRDELIHNGFETDLATDGKMAEKMFHTARYHIALLDINLPFKNGIELCAMIRQTNKDLPVIMLTALGELEDKMEAFGKGADDYLVKPFHMNELLARINVFVKRKFKSGETDEILKLADLELDNRLKIARRGGKEISLTTKEYALIEYLFRAEGRVVSKNEISEKIWHIGFDTGTNTIEVYINFLRNKIDKPFGNKLIHTKAGFGYFLKDEEA